MILAATDLHFGARNDDELLMQYQLKFIDDVLIPTIQQNNVTHVFNLGDTWDKRKIVNIRTFNIFRERFFGALNDIGVEHVMLIGNHDVYYKNTNEVNSVAMLERDFANIRVIHEFEDLEVNGRVFGMMSWINAQNYDKAKQFLQDSKASIICGHFEAKGFELFPGVKSEHGIDPELFNRFHDVWSGHFHIPSRRGNFEYIGNPFDLTWSDYGQRKSVLLYDELADTKQYVENPHRMFAVADYSDSTDILKYDFDKYKDKIVRINVERLAVEDNSKLTIFIDSMQRAARSVEVIDRSKITVSDTVVDVSAGDQTDMLTRILTAARGISADGLDQARVEEMLKTLYQDALDKKAQ